MTCTGKGRKQRITPLTKDTVTTLKNWTKERGGLPTDPLFPTRSGTAITPDALERRVAKHAATAELACPTLAEKTISPHVLRHTAAMRLLNAGVDTTVIALWLGHESVATTQIYVHAEAEARRPGDIRICRREEGTPSCRDGKSLSGLAENEIMAACLSHPASA